jgi:SAM-dependent methyltransferase
MASISASQERPRLFRRHHYPLVHRWTAPGQVLGWGHLRQATLRYMREAAPPLKRSTNSNTSIRKGTDVFGRALMDWARGGTAPEIIERDDGFTDLGAGHELYVANFRDWPASERQSMRYARGRIIDVGCGAGRVTLYLQQRGFDVVGLDASPLAIRSARLRGVKEAWCMSIDDLSERIASFDTMVLFGNNFGVFGTPERLHRMLGVWARRTKPASRILAQSTSPYCGGAPAFDRAYYQRNKQIGRMPGQSRIRTRYRGYVGAWSDWLFVSRQEMRGLLRGTGWHQVKILGASPSDSYVAVLEKD